MTVDELLLNINLVEPATIVCQTKICSKKDLTRYQKMGYTIVHTKQQFQEKYPSVDPSCVFYTPSISCSSLYFNPETLAVCSLPFLGLQNAEGSILSSDIVINTIRNSEKCAKEKDFMLPILSLPDNLRFVYFEKLIAKYGTNVPDLYRLFFSTYCGSDYGFGNISPKVIEAVLSAKTEEEKAETADKLAALPETITVYRGGNTESTKPEAAYSWTTDINVANFFATRRGTQDGYIVKGEVRKEDILEYFPDTSEQEVIIAPGKVHITEELCVYGVSFIKEHLPLVAEKYHKYKALLDKLHFAQDSDVHGKAHELRVLLLCLMIAEHLHLSDAETDVLATAAIYHDTQRTNDDVDPCHGKAGRAYYEASVKKPNLLVSILCEYHCLPDEEGHSIIRSTFKNKEKQQRYVRLFNIFKDADALDRVRFGLRDLDLNYLRMLICRQLSLVARICFNHND